MTSQVYGVKDYGLPKMYGVLVWVVEKSVDDLEALVPQHDVPDSDGGACITIVKAFIFHVGFEVDMLLRNAHDRQCWHNELPKAEKMDYMNNSRNWPSFYYKVKTKGYK